MIEVTIRDDIAVLSMVHGKANAMDTAFCETLTRQFENLKLSSARAVVLTAPGRIFSAGVDLIRGMGGGADYFREFLPALHRALETMFFFPKPLVAAVNGHAIAGGCLLACSADRRVMARGSGMIGVTELLVGLPFPALALEIMRYVTVSHRFEEVVFGAGTYTPEAAIDLGLVNEIVEPAQLLDHAIATAARLASLSPEAFALTKRHCRLPVTERIYQHGARIEAEATAIWTAPQTFDRIRDYVTRTFKKA